MSSYARLGPAVTFSLLMTTGALAQQPRVQLAAKGGVTIESSEDNLTGTVPAFGLTATAGLTPDWRAEFEFWLPGYLDDTRGEPKHRDVLFSFAAVRMFDAGRVKPFVVAGLTFARTEDWFTFCTANRVPPDGGPTAPALVSCDEPDVLDVRREKNVGSDGYLIAGGGVEIPLSPHVVVVADLRVNLAPVSVLVRPSAGMAVRF